MPWPNAYRPISNICSPRNHDPADNRWYTWRMPKPSKPEIFVLIPGRTSRQGTTLNEGKFSADYTEETTTLSVNPDDMKRLGLQKGARVRLRTAQGQVELSCQPAKAGELPT